MNGKLIKGLLGTFFVGLSLVGMIFVGLAEAQDSETPPLDSTPVPEETPTPAPLDSVREGLSTTIGGVTEASLQDIIQVLLSVVVIFLVAYFSAKLIIFLLKRISRRTETEIDDELLEVIKPQISWFMLALGFQFATNSLEFLDEGVKKALETIYFLIYVFVITVTIWRVSDYLLDHYIRKNKGKLNETLVEQIMPLTKRVAHIVLVFLACVIVAGYFGVDILAISAALGLTGFAFALAAKDTITNIISGFVLMVSAPFSIGDRIDIPSLDTWGDVVTIGIRSTTVVTRDNRLVIVPNSTIVDDAVVNYSLPDTTYRLESDTGIGAGEDIPKVQEMIRETVRKQEGVLPDKPVDVWFIEFADSSNTFRVRWWVANYGEKRSSTHRINTAIQELANRENIDMPNPIYTLENKVSLTDDYE